MKSETKNHIKGTDCLNSISIAIVILLLFSCNAKKNDRAETIDKLVGKEVKFGNGLIEMNSNGQKQLNNYEYQIVLYTDSAGCMDCAFDLQNWQDLMKLADTTLLKPTNFKFIFHPAAKEQLQSLM